MVNDGKIVGKRATIMDEEWTMGMYPLVNIQRIDGPDNPTNQLSPISKNKNSGGMGKEA